MTGHNEYRLGKGSSCSECGAKFDRDSELWSQGEEWPWMHDCNPDVWLEYQMAEQDAWYDARLCTLDDAVTDHQRWYKSETFVLHTAHLRKIGDIRDAHQRMLRDRATEQRRKQEQADGR